MKPTLAITMGDPAGVGPEIVVKVLSSRTIDRARIIVVGDVPSLSKAMNETGCNVKFAPIASVAEVADCDGIPILEPIDVDHSMVTTGTVSAEAGRAAGCSHGQRPDQHLREVQALGAAPEALRHNPEARRGA